MDGFKRKFRVNCLIFILSVITCGCVSNSGVQRIGADTYLIINKARFAVVSAETLKLDAYKEADAYCQKLHRNVVVKDTNESRIPLPDKAKYLSKIEVTFFCYVDDDIKTASYNMKGASRRQLSEEEIAANEGLNKIPDDWPQFYFYVTDDYRHWTVCGDVMLSQSEAVLSSKSSADDIFYSEYPKSKYGNLNYETTYMQIVSNGKYYKHWRIIRMKNSL
jgi:hypothetical protein